MEGVIHLEEAVYDIFTALHDAGHLIQYGGQCAARLLIVFSAGQPHNA